MSMLFKRIKDWAITITAFRTGDVIPVDGPSGTAKMAKDDLLKVTAENALGSIHSLSETGTEADLVSGNYFALDGSAGTKKLSAGYVGNIMKSLAPLYDATRTASNPYQVNDVVMYGGALHVCNTAHYGTWDARYFYRVDVDTLINNVYGAIYGSFPYNGDLTAINADATVDTSKSYYVAIKSSTAYMTRMVYSGGVWVYSRRITPTLQAVLNSLSFVLGMNAYYGDKNTISADPNADKTRLYLDVNPTTIDYGKVMSWSPFHNMWVANVDYISVFDNLNKLVGAVPYFIGGLTAINSDTNVDTSKVYYVATAGTNYLKKMKYDSGTSAWVYSDLVNLDLTDAVLLLIGDLFGALPYFGNSTTLNADSTADRSKVYFVALKSSTQYLRTMIYDNGMSAWVYGDKVTAIPEGVLNIENEKVRAYLDDTAYDNTDYTYTEVLKYAADNYDKPNGFSVTWEFAGTCDSFNVKVSLTGDFADGKTYTYNIANTARSFVVKNLDPSKVAGVKVSSVTGGVESVVISKAIPCEGSVRMLDVGGIRNVRDIGGWDCGNGKRIKYGKFFRGSAIDESGSTITSAGKAVLYNLCGVRAEIDLRSTSSPTTSDIGASCVKYSITGDSYINGFNNTSDAYNVFRRVFTEITSGHPIYMHCSGGCDRTAFYVCMLEGLLGVSENDITKDFELSSFMDKAYSNNYRRYRSMGAEYTNRDWLGLITLIKGLTGSTWGEKFETYFTSLGFTQSDIDAVRDAMLE